MKGLPLFERFIHGVAHQEASQEDVQAQVSKAHQSQQAQAQVAIRKGPAWGRPFLLNPYRSLRKSSISSTSCTACPPPGSWASCSSCSTYCISSLLASMASSTVSRN